MSHPQSQIPKSKIFKVKAENNLPNLLGKDVRQNHKQLTMPAGQGCEANAQGNLCVPRLSLSIEVRCPIKFHRNLACSSAHRRCQAGTQALEERAENGWKRHENRR
eukprot:scaffold255752_cov17-Tisochrysis_lutea.AAC.1